MARKAAERRGFGSVRRLGSGNYQARYVGPDLARHAGPATFITKIDAEAWLLAERRLVSEGKWTPPASRNKPEPKDLLTFGGYAAAWLDGRLSKGQPLKPRTRDHYSRLIDSRLNPELGGLPVADITPAKVRVWYGHQDPKAPTMRAHAYALLRTILGTAVEESLLTVNPCTIKGAQHAPAAHKARPATLAELATIVDNLPAKYRMLVLLAAWGAFRYGELAELRRSDIDLEVGMIRVRRGVVRLSGRNGAEGQVIVGSPKSEAGVRTVAIPPHLIGALREHLAEHAQFGRDGLLFPSVKSPEGTQLSPHTFYRHFERACEAAGRPDLHVHDLRHTGAVLAAQTGATLADLMARLGHSTPQAAMRYQHAGAGRDQMIADRLSQMAGGML